MNPLNLITSDTISDAWSLLDKKNKILSVCVLLVFAFASALELIALASVAPFVSLIIEPEIFLQNEYAKQFLTYIGNPPISELVYSFAVGVVILIILALITQLIAHLLIEWFGVRVATTLSSKLAKETVNAPYSWFLGQNSSEYSKRLYDDPYTVGINIYPTVMELFYTLFIMLFGILIIISTSPWQSLVVIFIIMAVSSVLLYVIKPRLTRYSSRMRNMAIECNRHGVDIVKGIKDIKIKKCQAFFLKNYNYKFYKAVLSRMKIMLLQRLIPMLIVMLGQIGLIAVALVLFDIGLSNAEIITQMTLLVIIISRLLPSITRTFGTVNKLSVSLPYMEGYKKTLTEITRLKSTITPNTGNRCIQNDWKKIEFNNVSYSYPESSNIALKNITIEIEHGKSYGIVGKSGSGKTTLVDLLLCLHTPEDGEILLDGYKLEEYQRNEWYSRIGYVPQFPFIIDDTLIRNIAFGKKDDDIDIERVKHVIDMSGLTDVVHNLPNDVDTILGDDGLRMSGGQRQRIAIARALYDKPDILILDEATSALDTITEREIQRTINLLHGTVTTITIAHRISTVSVCDSIFLLNNGELEAFGDYNNLISSSRLFKKLAGKS